MFTLYNTNCEWEINYDEISACSMHFLSGDFHTFVYEKIINMFLFIKKQIWYQTFYKQIFIK